MIQLSSWQTATNTYSMKLVKNSENTKLSRLVRPHATKGVTAEMS